MKKILIIEDDNFVANIYRNKYLATGYDARIALTGEEGMIQLKSFQPDLVQLDLLLPIVDGIEIIKYIRGQPALKSMPVIVLSNSYMPKLVQDAWRAGADKCLAKADCTPRVMLEIIRNYFSPPPAPAMAGGTVFLSAPGKTGAPVALPEGDASFQRELQSMFREEAPGMLQVLRSLLQRFSKAASEENKHSSLADLHRKARSLANNAAIVGLSSLAHFAAVYEALAKELAAKAQHVNASSLRTLAQGIDQLDQLVRTSGLAESYTPAAFKIMVVDDEIISRRAVAHSLEKAALNCVSVADPLGALAMLNENRFDLIFLDVEMPVMSGFELCQKLRSLPAHQQTPVVFVTGLTDFQSRANSALSGGNDLIAKPFLFTELALKALCFLLKPKP